MVRMKEHLRTRLREAQEKEAADKKQTEEDARAFLEVLHLSKLY